MEIFLAEDVFRLETRTVPNVIFSSRLRLSGVIHSLVLFGYTQITDASLSGSSGIFFVLEMHWFSITREKPYITLDITFTNGVSHKGITFS